MPTTNQLEDLKTRLSSLSAEQLAALRLSYSYRLLQAWLRNMGWVNLFLGGLTFLLGIGIPGNTLLKAIQAFLGLVTIIVSLWSILFPLAIGAVIWGVLLGIAGTWNIFIAISYQGVVVGAFGVLQLWWAYRCYRDFRKNAETTWPGVETLRLYDNLQRAVRSFEAKEGEDSDFIRLKFNRRWWQGFLLQDRAVLASRQGIALLIAEGSKTTFTFRDGKGILRKRIVGTFDLDGISAKNVTFPQATLEAYNRWKGIPDIQTAEWLNALDLDSRKRLPVRIVAILILAAPIAFLLFWAVFAILMVAKYGK